MAFWVGLFDPCSLLSYTEELRKSYTDRPRAGLGAWDLRLADGVGLLTKPQASSLKPQHFASRIELLIIRVAVRRRGFP